MSSRFLHPGSDESAETAHDIRHEERGSSVRITVTVADRYTFDTKVVTGRQIKETAGVPRDFALYRPASGGKRTDRGRRTDPAPER
jgi:hypothetical protein